jgi:processive 1,2-diacylglycerol beta-glucosyltransferase
MSESLPRSPGKRVLVLSVSAGAGHLRAAEALMKDFQEHPSIKNGGSVQHWDFGKYSTPFFRAIHTKLLPALVNRAPWVLGMVYQSTDIPWKEGITRALEKFNAGPFIKAFRDYQPDLVVCTEFTPAHIISWLNTHKKGALGGGKKIFPAIVVTDFDVHAMWFTRSYSRYFVALPETKVYMQRLGIPEDKITISGIPIDPVFRIPKDQTAARRALGLDPNLTTLLVSAGGFGTGPVELVLAQLQTMKIPAQVVAIAGKSEELKARLDKLAKKTPADAPVKLHPVGFTRQMDDYMAASDLLISKAGGLTTSEAMARGLPMCIVNPIPGQEERNSDHLLEAGVAIRCNNPPALGWKIESLLRDPTRLETMRTKARAFGQPLAGAIIVKELLG